MLKAYNYFNNQFTFSYYLETNGFDKDLITFAENHNNMSLNYVCFASCVEGELHTLVTTNLKNNPTNGYRSIIINKVDVDDINKIVIGLDVTTIYYNNIMVKISNVTDLHIIEAAINLKTLTNRKFTALGNINNKVNTFDGFYKYNKNFNPVYINTIKHVTDSSILSVLNSIENAHIVNDLDFRNIILNKVYIVGQYVTVIPMARVIKFGDHCGKIFNFPPTVREIIFDHQFNEELKPLNLPEGLEKIRLGFHYKHELIPGIFPDSVHTIIYLGHIYGKLKNNVFPQSLKKLVMPNLSTLNSTWLTQTNYFPDDFKNYNIEKISLEYCDSDMLKYLPISITNIKINDFRQYPGKMITNNIKKVNIKRWDSGSTRGGKMIFSRLETMKVRNFLNCGYKVRLPETIKKIKLRGNVDIVDMFYFTTSIGANDNNILPIYTLVLNNIIGYHISIIPTLKKLIIKTYAPYYKLPKFNEGLEKLELGGFNGELTINCFPTSLKALSFGHNFCQKLNYLQPSLKKLFLGAHGAIFTRNQLPNSLIKFSFGGNYQKVIKGLLPDSIEYLVLCYEHKEVFSLPKNIKTLVITCGSDKWKTKLPQFINVEFR
jgi:hypothetical protein